MRIPVLMIVVVYLLSILTDLYIFFDIRRYASARRKPLYERIYAVVSFVLIVAVTVAFCLPRRSAESSIIPLMWIFYSYLSIYFAKILYVVCSAVGRLFAGGRKRRHNHGVLVGAVLGCAFFIIMWWGVLFTRNEIHVERVDVVSERLPKGFDGFRIVQFSDAHVGTWGQDTVFVSRLVDSINAQRPDVIVFTGDIVNRSTSELEPFLTTLARLKAPGGVYSILGNHDYGDYMEWNSPAERDANNALLAEWERQMGWTLLNNEHRFLHAGNDSIALIGVENWGDPPFPQYGDLMSAYPANDRGLHLKDSNYKILLTHNPAHWAEEVTKISNIDLSLAGHTHAMQSMVRIGDWKWSPAVLRYKLWGGMYSDVSGRMNMYVNIGAGEVGMPSRIGAAYPEITVFDFRSKK